MPDSTPPTRSGPPRWLLAVAAIVVVPLAVTAIAVLADHDDIQDDLTQRSRQALDGAGLGGATVDFTGRDAAVHAVPAGREQAAKDAVLGVDGVRVASVETARPPAAPLTVATHDGTVVLSGAVPDEATKADVERAASASGKPVDNQLTVQQDAHPIAADQAGTLATALGTAQGDHAATVDGATVTLTGSAQSDQARTALGEQAGQAVAGATVDNLLTVSAPQVDRQALQQRLTALLAAAPITFEPNTATLTPSGAQSVQQVAAILAEEPSAKAEIDGHVARTPGTAVNPQALSDQRAATVSAQLVGAGVAADRLTAKGFGDTRPVAPSTTPAGQAANRRVEIVVL